MPISSRSVLKKALRIAVLAVLFMSMAGIGAYLALTLIIKNEETVIVPDLVGKDVLYGLELLSDLGLNTRVKGTRYDDQVPKHYIIDQEPEPGSAIKQGRDVRISVSRGPESIAMPNLTGLSIQQSRILLTENGLCQGVQTTMSSSTNTAGRIMAQFPLPGVTVPRSRCVDLLISRGPLAPGFAMVDLKGFALETAIRHLERLQLTAGHIRVVHRKDAPLETVVDQDPLPGYRVVQGDPVALTVNRSIPNQRSGSKAGSDGVEFYRFVMESGFLRKRVQVKLNQPRVSLSLFDDFLAPGQEIWLLIPKNDNPTLLVYVDNQLVESRIID
jgi:beta-lactam-binding protein with PASTA domain